MLDLWIFGVTKKFLSRVNRLEKANIQTIYIILILDRFMAAAVPYDVVAGFRNAGVSLIMEDDSIIRSNVASHAARCLLESVIWEDLLGLAEQEEKETNV
jgi:hypothetical protein